jgi:hypothetical protein
MVGPLASIDVNKREIYLVSDAAPNAKLEILLHEAGHIFQPALWSMENFGPSIYREQAEFFAEAVARGVMKYYGLTYYNQVSYRYLLLYKGGLGTEKVFEREIQVGIESLVGLRKGPTFKEGQ